MSVENQVANVGLDRGRQLLAEGNKCIFAGLSSTAIGMSILGLAASSANEISNTAITGEVSTGVALVVAGLATLDYGERLKEKGLSVARALGMEIKNNFFRGKIVSS